MVNTFDCGILGGSDVPSRYFQVLQRDVLRFSLYDLLFHSTSIPLRVCHSCPHVTYLQSGKLFQFLVINHAVTPHSSESFRPLHSFKVHRVVPINRYAAQIVDRVLSLRIGGESNNSDSVLLISVLPRR